MGAEMGPVSAGASLIDFELNEASDPWSELKGGT